MRWGDLDSNPQMMILYRVSAHLNPPYIDGRVCPQQMYIILGESLLCRDTWLRGNDNLNDVNLSKSEYVKFSYSSRSSVATHVGKLFPRSSSDLRLGNVGQECYSIHLNIVDYNKTSASWMDGRTDLTSPTLE